MKRIFLIAALLLCVVRGPSASAQAQYPFRNPALPVEQRIDNVLSLLTLQEKIDLLGKSINVPRLGIHAQGAVATVPGSGGQFEGLHGLALDRRWGTRSPGGAGPMGGRSAIPTTQFPQASGLGETWDPAIVQQAAAEEAREARFIYQRYDRGGLILRAPNADLARDPRWGRSDEAYGEDPYLVGTMAVAFVRGLQGNDSRTWLAAALAKHFMANSNEDGREGSSSNFDARLLHEYYAAPFRMAVEQGGANAIMASFNAVNGIPMTANPLFKSLLVGQWGFNGIIDTDRDAVTDMVTKNQYFPNLDEAVAGALHIGVNQFLNPYEESVHADLQKKLIHESDIDANLRGLFRVLIRLGLLDPPAMVPYARIGTEQEPAPCESDASKALALRVTRESIVLLKNAPFARKPLLPLDASSIHSIAVLGPRADKVYIDGYGGQPPFAITPLQGIRAAAGASIDVRTATDHDQAVALARSSDVAIVLLGNDPMSRVNPVLHIPFGYTPDPTEGLEGIDRKQINLNPEQQKLLQDVTAANPRTVLVLVSGFSYTIDWAQQHVPAILHMTHSSEQEGAALADVLFGDSNPAGRVTVTWPQSLAQVPPMMDYNLRHGRTYMYFKAKPLYAFGHGLSYTSFRYANLRISSSRLRENGEATVSVDVTNTGSRAGDEVVQMYVQHVGSKVDRPREELKGFARLSLKPGETKSVQLPLAAKDLAYWNVSADKWTVEHDRVRVMVGGASDAIKLTKLITVVP
ncbi:MAG: glycoside hydrolase family 3 C-terminal domain-containing protein [Terracidiphilus sp.]|nr:glycoside hydrolase family 3 C-terminal domain-containing protein [Terracidiphilus sp.]